MKKRMHFLPLLGTTLGLFSSILAACGLAPQTDRPAQHTVTVFVIGSSSIAPKIDAATAQSHIDDLALQDGDSAGIVLADGEPTALGTVTVDLSGANNEQQKKKQLDLVATDLVGALQMPADDPEVDLFTTLEVAARSFPETGQADETRRLVLLIPGISTTGPLNMTNETLFALEPETVANAMIEGGYTVDLEGVDVVWYYLTDVAGSQPELTHPAIDWLEDFWQRYLTQCGASVTFATALPPEGEPDVANLPPITPVPVPEEGFRLEDMVTEEEEPAPIALPQSLVSFQPDSTAFANPTAAQSILDEIGMALADSDANYVIAGCCADDGSDSQRLLDFSRQRAETVKAALEQAGVAADRLTAVGLGALDWSQRSENDEANRVVYLIPQDSSLATEVLALAS